MIQRKCGTCRYFEEGGIASSGWCRHPERQDLQHMVLVRKTELACRDGWDHDLWEPKDEGSQRERSMSSVPAGASSGRSDHGQLNGASWFDSVGGVPASEATGTPDAQPGNHQRPTHRVPMEARQPDDDRPTTRDRESAIHTQSSSSDAAQQLDEVRDETFSTRGLRPDAEWRRHLSELKNRGTSSGHESVPTPSIFTRDEDETVDDDGDEYHIPGANELQSEQNVHDSQVFGARPEASNDREYYPEPVQQSGLTEPFEFAPTESEPASEPQQDEIDHFPETTDAFEPETAEPLEGMDSADVPDLAEPLELPMAVQGERCCRTCRDFLPTDGGKRGWCNNAFAFEKRQQVDGDGIACQGTFGNWWSPADDWWIERADISHHSAPTPLVESLIREIRDRRSGEQGSTGRSERS